MLKERVVRCLIIVPQFPLFIFFLSLLNKLYCSLSKFTATFFFLFHFTINSFNEYFKISAMYVFLSYKYFIWVSFIVSMFWSRPSIFFFLFVSSKKKKKNPETDYYTIPWVLKFFGNSLSFYLLESSCFSYQ